MAGRYRDDVSEVRMNIYHEICREKLNSFLKKEWDFNRHLDFLVGDVKSRLLQAEEIVVCGLTPIGKRVLTHIGDYTRAPVNVLDIRNENFGHGGVVYNDGVRRTFVICSREESIRYLDLIPRCNSHVITYNEMILLDVRFGIKDSLLHDRGFITGAMENVFSRSGEYLEMLEGLSDRFSKETLSRWLLYRLYADIDAGRNIAGKGKPYFDPDFIRLRENEVFVDAGGYDGDTLDDFINLTGNRYEKYYFFEPEGRVYEMARKKHGNDDRIEFIRKGLAEATTVKYFDNECEDVPEMMQSDHGNVAVEVVALDDMAIAPTYIKMDIEGAECDALDGARKTIGEHMPKLAICVYHRPNDILDIYHRIRGYGYRDIYLRADRDSLDYDVVLYARHEPENDRRVGV